MNARRLFGATRLILSFSLLGALVAGTFFGWTDTVLDPRAVGAIAGGAGILVVKLLHVI